MNLQKSRLIKGIIYLTHHNKGFMINANARKVEEFLPFRARKLYSFWDMNKIFPYKVFEASHEIDAWNQLYQHLRESVEDKRRHLSVILEFTTKILEHARKYGLAETKVHCESFKTTLEEHLRYQSNHARRMLSKDLVQKSRTNIIFSLKKEMEAMVFAFIEPGRAQYFEQEKLFGEVVYEKFPSAHDEVKNAGNCLAADLNTAAVFHLMRTTNIGLRALARSVGVKKIANKKLEYCTDAQIINDAEKAIETKMQAVGIGARGEKWEKQNSFYRGLLVDLRFFKDVVRDPISHARKSYTEPGAMDVYAHVRDFMQRLAAGGVFEKP